MPPRKRATARPADEPTVGPPGPSGVSPDPPAVGEAAAVAAKEEASGLSGLAGTGPDDDLDADLVMDAETAQPSDPTRCGGYVLVEGQGWRPASKE